MPVRRPRAHRALLLLALPPSAALAAGDPPAPRADIVVTARGAASAAGQTATTVDDRSFRDAPAFTVADMLRLSPGVTVIGGNGPRDVGVSIRGSNARNSFGARNIRVTEDGFPVTQPDGLARFDLVDPHAYGGVEVLRGPSSARYGNYAIEGAIDFRSRAGREVGGIEPGFEGGSFGYRNGFATVGGAGAAYDYVAFGSYVRAGGAIGHSGYETGTVNALGTVALSDRDRLTGKFIFNQGLFRLSTRLSFDQFDRNPYQRGCARAADAAAGCGTITVFANGRNGARVAQTAVEGGLARDDSRAITGLRYEHDLSDTLTWRTQGVYDRRIVYQPTSANPFRGRLNSHDIASDLVHHGRLFGMAADGVIGVTYSRLNNRSFTFNKTPAGRDGYGAPLQTVLGNVRHVGGHAREELAIAPRLTFAAGIGGEHSVIDVRQTAFAYPANGDPRVTVIPVRRSFGNVAPEASLSFAASKAVRLHVRIATAYGIPQSGQLFVTPAGAPGDNAALRTQRNTGLDVGATVKLGDRLTAELTGYYEWFRNEQVTQSAGVNLLAFTTNAPRSIHRGVEVGATWRPLAAAYVQANYSYNDQRYTRFVERLSGGAASVAFDRDGNRIPGVIPHFANVRLGYDRPAGAVAGLGGFAELTVRSRYAIDNANLLRVPGCTLGNLDLHYAPPGASGWWSRLSLFVAVQNVADRTCVGSASVIADSLDAAGRQNPAAVLRAVTGSLYAGAPRTFVAGLRSRL